MPQYWDTSGNIRVQVGRSLDAIRNAIGAHDEAGMVDQINYLVTLASPKIDKDARAGLALPPLPGRDDRAGTQRAVFVRGCLEVVEKTLRLLAEQRIYTSYPLPETDGSGLVVTGGDDDDAA